MEESCESCRFFKPEKDKEHPLWQCRRFPPQLVVYGNQFDTVSPYVDSTYWCGEFQAVCGEKSGQGSPPPSIVNGTSIDVLASFVAGRRILPRIKQHGITHLEQFTKMTNDQAKEVCGKGVGFNVVVRTIKKLGLEWDCRFPTPKAEQ